jgi:D-lactate dehydrogenase
MARWCAEHFDLVEAGLRHALRAGHLADRLLGTEVVTAITRSARRLGGRELPLWSADVPHAAPRWSDLFAAAAPFTADPAHAAAVYVPACLTRTMGRAAASTNPAEAGSHALQDHRGGPGPLSLLEAIARVAARAGRPVHVPFDAPGFCCGVPFSSKGYPDAHAVVVNRSFERLWSWSDHGRLPVVIDTSPCAYGLQTCRPALTPDNQARFDRMPLVDVVSFVHGLLPWLAPRHVRRRVALHPVCSLVKAGLADNLATVARACADEVLVPRDAGCCGFAGDRGFLVPELTASATAREAAEVLTRDSDGYCSSSRTCEIGLSRATGHTYESIVYLVEEATRDVLR